MRMLIFLTLLSAAMWSCSGTTRKTPDSHNYYTITKAEIIAAAEKRPIRNAYELIESIRPKYLTPRIQNSVSKGAIRKEAIIYLNNVRLGGTSELYNFDIDQIAEIQYLKAYEATQRFGIGHEGGVIIIRTR